MLLGEYFFSLISVYSIILIFSDIFHIKVIFFYYFQVAVRELTPVDDTVERTGLKASIKAAHKAHKAGLKASLKAKIAAHKAQKKGYTPVDDTVERTGLKASIKAKAAAHKAHKAQKKGNLNIFFTILSILI